MTGIDADLDAALAVDRTLATLDDPFVDPFADLRLTEWTSCGGCAAKWGAALLTDMVRDMP
ncbi:MAG TPA: hypothetical protein VHQ23_11320, partial [Ilumatobacteraceae bacterium]|nr:hypothetical protein [Ilumatobacteraceae bacterium]